MVTVAPEVIAVAIIVFVITDDMTLGFLRVVIKGTFSEEVVHLEEKGIKHEHI